MLDRPEYIFDSYLSVLLAQMASDGYSVFVVTGNIPRSDADAYCESVPVPDPVLLQQHLRDAREQKQQQKNKRAKVGADKSDVGGKGHVLGGGGGGSGQGGMDGMDEMDGEDVELQRALAISMMGGQSHQSKESGNDYGVDGEDDDDDADELEKAIMLSLSKKNDVEETTKVTTQAQIEAEKRPEETDAEMVRRKRLEKLMNK
jgi:hypothetical protein